MVLTAEREQERAYLLIFATHEKPQGTLCTLLRRGGLALLTG
jgi:hypothetical protein